MNALGLQILGPLRLWRNDVELDAGPPQQAYLLALLLARAGRPVSTTELIDLLWEDAPDSALNVIQRYVGALRRLLEPELAIRGSGSYLQRRGSSYLFLPSPGMLDLFTFRMLVGAAKAALVQQRHDSALDQYVDAVELWHGSAGDGLNLTPAAIPTFAALNEEFYAACVASAELATSLGRPERMLQPLQLAASMTPLHEPVQASLVSALAAAGQQAEALSVFQRVRARLVEELGIDPGPALQEAHQRVLSQAPTSAHRTPISADAGDTSDEAGSETAAEAAAVDGKLIGRAEELGVLRQTLAAAAAGRSRLVLVEGEPGVGKTRLLEEAATLAARRGALTVWGRCLVGDGAPVMWPWMQAARAVIQSLPSAARDEWLGGEVGRLVETHDIALDARVLPDAGAQFRLFEQVVAVIGEVGADRPVMLVIDDLQWADVASLQVFGHLATHLPRGALVVGALRDRAPAPGPELTRMLAEVSRVPGHRRIRLGPLGPAEVAELVHNETGEDPGSAAVHSIHARTAGNPFFVRELSRLLAESGGLAQGTAVPAGVPSTVRDIVRDRMVGLDASARELLQIAAIIGRDVDLGLLASAAGLTVQTCLDCLEPMEALGLLAPAPGDPFAYRFAHDLVRESVAAITPARQVIQIHLRVADAVERTDPNGGTSVERLAHHLWAAGPLADPARTARALVRAGNRAAAKFAFAAAERHLRSAAQLARTAGLAELELSCLSQLASAVGIRVGYAGPAAELLDRAEQLARDLGREREAADLLFSRWAARQQTIELDRSGPLARRLLERGEASSDPVVRAYGLYSWGIYQWNLGDIGEAFRHLSRLSQTRLDDLGRREDNPLRHDLQLLGAGMLAETTALHGDVDGARAMLDAIEAAAGDDPYVNMVWATFATRIATIVGDPVWALHAAERGIAQDPEFSMVFLGTYQRLARCWARAVTDQASISAANAAEAEELIAANLLDPPRSGVAAWSALVGEAWLASGELDKAAAALERAEHFQETTSQRYAEGLILLLRARLLQARGAPADVVRVAAERARALSIEREAHLFARRAEELLAALGSLAASPSGYTPRAAARTAS